MKESISDIRLLFLSFFVIASIRGHFGFLEFFVRFPFYPTYTRKIDINRQRSLSISHWIALKHKEKSIIQKNIPYFIASSSFSHILLTVIRQKNISCEIVPIWTGTSTIILINYLSEIRGAARNKERIVDLLILFRSVSFDVVLLFDRFLMNLRYFPNSS